MTWTYDNTEPTLRDKVRGVIGDTNIKDQILTNEVLDSIIVEFTTKNSAVREALRRILAKTAPNVDRNAGGINSQRSQAWEFRSRLLDRLEQEANLDLAGYAGGVSQIDKDATFANPDYVANSFTVRGDDSDKVGPP